MFVNKHGQNWELPAMRSLCSSHRPLAWVLFGKGGLHAWQPNCDMRLLPRVPVDLGDCIFAVNTNHLLCLKHNAEWVWGAWHRPWGRVSLSFLLWYFRYLAAASTHSGGQKCPEDEATGALRAGGCNSQQPLGKLLGTLGKTEDEPVWII